MHRKSAFHPAYRRSQPPGVRRRRVLVGGARRAGEPVPGEAQFTSLPGAFPGLVTAIQAVDDEPRYHVDIETDDVAAETARLVALGAVELRRWLDCRILRAPGGHLLCVIPLHSDPDTFRRLARVWG